MEFLFEYGIFLAKSLTVLLVFIVIIMMIGAAASVKRASNEGSIRVKKLQEDLDNNREHLLEEILPKSAQKKRHKRRQKEAKQAEKQAKKDAKKTPETSDEATVALAKTAASEKQATPPKQEATETQEQETQEQETQEQAAQEQAVTEAQTTPEQEDKENQADQAQAETEPTQEQTDPESKPQYFVLDFDGDIKASEVENLRKEISAVLSVARPQDEVIVRLESPGGMVHAYGLAASQLARIKKAKVPLTICVDKVAASGGYMMACLADKIIAAPFAVVGSIGVVAEVPNIHRLLKKNDIDVDVLTAGEHKRTLTFMGQNTRKGKEKFVEDLNMTHDLFKHWVAEQRPQVNIDEVANGEIWYGQQALKNKLIDEVGTSDDYLSELMKQKTNVLQVSYEERRTLGEKIGVGAASILEAVSDRVMQIAKRDPF